MPLQNLPHTILFAITAIVMAFLLAAASCLTTKAREGARISLHVKSQSGLGDLSLAEKILTILSYALVILMLVGIGAMRKIKLKLCGK